MARQPGTVSAVGETAWYVEGVASEAGETPPRWIRFFCWRYSIVKGSVAGLLAGLQVATTLYL